MTVLTTFIKVIITLALTILMTKCAMNTWPIPVILRTDQGLLAYAWLLTLLDLEGIEEGEEMLIAISLCMGLATSTVVCALLTKGLRKIKHALTSRSTRQ
ncbi:MAG: hypothetical protein EOO38_28885 [Cytophagaceae bacterium]|uniref:Uncharacterized protein n=1 Tax=Pseudomonas graminis TaxID=158627 RepID=A0A1C2DV04_9PSED|nr:hypothetical protein BBI10_16555 [Pseudomonas graminis]RYF35442.1 MAG: hypothetical protein EOO38_28885 [Cytophagaceae bacterium]